MSFYKCKNRGIDSSRDMLVYLILGNATIDEKIIVNGSPQYKVHNSKSKTYYVTANEAYVYVE